MLSKESQEVFEYLCANEKIPEILGFNVSKQKMSLDYKVVIEV